MRARRLQILLLAWSVGAAAAGAAAQDHQHQHGGGGFGTIEFPVTCAPAVQQDFSRAVAILHSFGYEESRRQFLGIAKKDPVCGMAQWGVAMTYYHPIWAAPTSTELAAGRAAAAEAAKLGARTARENRLIAAIGSFFLNDAAKDHRSRATAYRKAMENAASEFPDDKEIRIFYALAILGAASPADTTFAAQKQAAKILNSLLPSTPDHPGILHYLIHSFDYPALAPLALDAARAYSKVAPDSAHALHMPSHIFTRLGLWDECVASNIASSKAAKAQVARTHPGRVAFDDLHALDYLAYAYLQRGDDEKARAVLDEISRASQLDEPQFAAAYALAAVPARWALERRDWRAAAALRPPALPLPWEQFPYVKGITSFANAIGAARSGNVARARVAHAELETLAAQLAKHRPAGPYDWAGQVESTRLAAAGWLAFAEGRKEDAVRLLTQAVELERKVGKHAVTPGAILPAAELLGDLLLELNRPADALAAYRASLADAPRRFNSVAGAARAAELSGGSTDAKPYYEELLALCKAPCTRQEARRAEVFLRGSQ
jgi:tetratricopeptide (TPR) repeat protein